MGLIDSFKRKDMIISDIRRKTKRHFKTVTTISYYKLSFYDRPDNKLGSLQTRFYLNHPIISER